MDVELQRRIDGAVHKFLGKERNTVIEIQKMDFTNCRKSKSRRFVAATVANSNQASRFSKVHWEVGFDTSTANLAQESASLAGTPSRWATAWVLRMRRHILCH
jgi:hypothetical protein